MSCVTTSKNTQEHRVVHFTGYKGSMIPLHQQAVTVFCRWRGGVYLFTEIFTPHTKCVCWNRGFIPRWRVTSCTKISINVRGGVRTLFTLLIIFLIIISKMELVLIFLRISSIWVWIFLGQNIINKEKKVCHFIPLVRHQFVHSNNSFIY